jgi:site-specific recombinase XerD
MNTVVRQALDAHPHRIVEGRVCPLVFAHEDGAPIYWLEHGYHGALNRAGITRHVRFHDLRHTFASHLVMRGVDIRTVAQLLGHRDIKVTMRYAHLAPQHLQSAVDTLATPATVGQARWTA